MVRFRLLLLVAFAAAPLMADPAPLETFDGDAHARWRFFTDQVMGGVSTGAAGIEAEGERRYLHLTGAVSTENRGGFIQARRELPGGLPRGTQAIMVTARGNGERYYLHLRTTGTALPWQYYQAPFEPGTDWGVHRVPLSAFTPSGSLLRATPRPETVRSIAIVAYGRDHAADVAVAVIALE